MTDNSLVTVSIPTHNSEKTLALCLEAVSKQTYTNLEVNVVDGNSKDKTIAIAKEKGVKDIVICSGALLGARLEGLKMARGKYVLLLDSDQVLNKDAIERAIEKIEQGFDMLIFEETSCQDKTFIEKLFRLDRKLIHKSKNLGPASGALLPRFFRRDLLEKAFSQIPEGILQKVGGEDHMIIYYEAWQLSKKISILPGAVCHIEPKSLRQVIRSSYRWGYSRQEADSGRYKKLLSREGRRVKMSLTAGGTIKEKLASLTLLVLRGIPGELGFYKAKLDRWLKKSQS